MCKWQISNVVLLLQIIVSTSGFRYQVPNDGIFYTFYGFLAPSNLLTLHHVAKQAKGRYLSA